MRQLPLFDRPLQRIRLDRAARSAAPGADFLLDRAGDDLAERLGTVLRQFALGVDWGTATLAALRAMAGSGRVASMARLAPSIGTIAPGPAPTAVADVEHPPLGLACADLVVSLLALQGVDDLPGALARVRAALRPDGLFIGCLLGGSSLTELRHSFSAAEVEVEGGISPRVAPFADMRDLGGLLQRAGFALPVVDADLITVRYADPFRLLADLRAMGATNALAARRRDPLRRATLMRLAQVYRDRFSDPDGRVRATFELVWLSGWAPHASQQKPLRPGSAQMRLADALRSPASVPGPPRQDEA